MMSVIQVFRRLFQFSVAFNIFKVMAFTKSQRLFMLNTYFECVLELKVDALLICELDGWKYLDSRSVADKYCTFRRLYGLNFKFFRVFRVFSRDRRNTAAAFRKLILCFRIKKRTIWFVTSVLSLDRRVAQRAVRLPCSLNFLIVLEIVVLSMWILNSAWNLLAIAA